MIAAATVIAAGGLAIAINTTAFAATTLTNPGFESGGDARRRPAGRSRAPPRARSRPRRAGTAAASSSPTGRPSAYRTETFQTLTGLTNGSYTLPAWVRSGGGQTRRLHRAAQLRPGRDADQHPDINVDLDPGFGHHHRLHRTSAPPRIVSDARAGNWINVDDTQFDPSGGTGGEPSRIRGVDISSLKKNEDHGAVYSTSRPAGRRDHVLRQAGANYVRLKVWVNPADGYNNKARVLQMATRVKAPGMKLLIDFHYSDSWADPGKQVKPAAWNGSASPSSATPSTTTPSTCCNALRRRARRPTWCRWATRSTRACCCPTAAPTTGPTWPRCSPRAATRSRRPTRSTRVMLHLAEGGNNSLFRWWFDQAIARGVPFDVIGASYYPYWHGPLAGLQTNLNDMATRYNKDVVVAETAYGFTLAQNDSEPNIFNSSLQQAGGYPASPQGQAQELRAVFNVVRACRTATGSGVFYWEPAWTAVTGSGWDPTNPNSGNGWENQAVFDYNDRALTA